MTYSDVVGTILSYAGQGSGGDFESFVKTLVNGVYLRVLDEGRVPHEHREFTLTTESGKSQYGLPLYVRRVLNIEDPTTPQFVYETTARAFDKEFAGTTESGTPVMAYSLGTRGVQRQPAAAGVVSVEGEGFYGALDSGSNYKVRITGFKYTATGADNGALVSVQVTMNGLTAVSTSQSFQADYGIERIVKEPAAGYAFRSQVVVRDSSSNVLAVIPTWWDSPDYEWIEFHPIPDAAITYTVRAEMRKPPLYNDGDWPELPIEYHDLLVFGVTMDLLPSLGKPEIGDRHRTTYVKMLEALKRSNNNRPAGLHMFRDVHSSAGLRQRPQRPLIRGVDFGLVP